MVKLNKTTDYSKALESIGVKPADCIVLHFLFRQYVHHQFHYKILEESLSGILFDYYTCYPEEEIENKRKGYIPPYEYGTVFMVMKKEDPHIERIIEIAKELGSECEILQCRTAK